MFDPTEIAGLIAGGTASPYGAILALSLAGYLGHPDFVRFARPEIVAGAGIFALINVAVQTHSFLGVKQFLNALDHVGIIVGIPLWVIVTHQGPLDASFWLALLLGTAGAITVRKGIALTRTVWRV